MCVIDCEPGKQCGYVAVRPGWQTFEHIVAAGLCGYAQTVQACLTLEQIAVTVHRAIHGMLCRQSIKIWRH